MKFTEIKKGTIYKATNLINGKCYIGQTIRSFRDRISIHKHCSLKHKDSTYFHKAIRKYGFENFKWEVIFECDDKLVLNVMETFKIIVNNSHVSGGKGYNLTWGGEGSYGFKHTEETKRKHSEFMTGFKHTEEQNRQKSLRQMGDKNPNFGKTFSKEHCKKLSLSKKGIINRKYTDEIIDVSIQYRKEGKTVKEISLLMHIPQQTIQTWFKNKNIKKRNI